MYALARRDEPTDIGRLRQEMEDLFERFFDREEDWMPGRMLRTLRSFQRDMDELFDDFFGSDWQAVSGREERRFWPRFRTEFEDGHFVVRGDLPGVRPEDLEVTAAQNTLTIRGERKTGRGGEEVRRFSHSFTLPEPADPDKVRASLANGVLEVRVPLSPRVAGKRIPIEVPGGEAKRELKAA